MAFMAAQHQQGVQMQGTMVRPHFPAQTAATVAAHQLAQHPHMVANGAGGGPGGQHEHSAPHPPGSMPHMYSQFHHQQPHAPNPNVQAANSMPHVYQQNSGSFVYYA